MPEQFHFLQPLWLLALAPLALLVWRLWHATTGDNPWARIIDARLQALLLTGQTHRPSYLILWLLGLSWLLAILALANPVWEKQPRPLFQTSAARVIVLDLSRSMLNRDLKPSRLARARFKIEDILTRDEEGQTGLVVFAGDAFTVTPLTRDVDTIRALLTSLDPELMPVQGSRADLGLQKAGELLQQSGLGSGRILLLADGVSDDRASKVAARLYDRGYRVSVLGIGTQKPQPLTNAQGQLLRTRDGQLILPALETHALQAVAMAGGGRYHDFSSDITALLAESQPLSTENPTASDLQGQDWQSRGPWLVALLLPLAALAFRRGWLLSLVLLVGVLSPPRAAMAAGWDDLWQRPDQQAARALTQKDYERASRIAEDPLLRGIAEYRRGNYQQALENFSQANGVTADYDRGNALAKLGRYEEAIAAYDSALKSAPDMEDAQANKAAVEALLRQQQDKDSSRDKDGNEEKKNNGKQGGQDEQSQQDKDSQTNKQSGREEQSQQGKSSGQDKPSQQNQQSEQGEAAAKKEDADKHTFADASKALEEKEAEKDTAEEQKSADQAATEKQLETQAEQQATSGEPSPQITPTEGQQARAEILSSEEQMAAEQWLRRIPDDPGGLLRRKFLYQYQRRAQREGTGSEQPW
ncbi:MAG TPA: VWA domain-containing protein [Gammaproteobacteria bacterium]|nr:VWA domain-containing protein [Gammaproteobacteria bacterium]